jgi:hypothetical protein
MKHPTLTIRRLELLQSRMLHTFQLTNSMVTCGLKTNSWKKIYEDWIKVQEEMLCTIKKYKKDDYDDLYMWSILSELWKWWCIHVLLTIQNM